MKTKNQNVFIIKFFILLFFLFNASMLAQPGSMLWEKRADGSIDENFFLDDGKYVLLQSDEYLYFIETASGKEVWTAEVEDYTGKGLKLLWNEAQYIVPRYESLVSYDVHTGKILWEESYPEIDQDDYITYFNTKAGILIYYRDNLLRVDLKNGKELWRSTEIELNGDRNEKGLKNVFVAETPQGERFLIITDDGILLLNADTGEELWRNDDGELTDEEHLNAVSIFGSNALIFYDDDLISFLDLTKGNEIFTREQDIGDIEGFTLIEDVSGKDYLMLSLEDVQLMLNITDSKLEWETAEDELEGILLDAEATNNGKYLICHFMKRSVMGSDNGTYFFLVKLETETGKIHYKEKIAWTAYAKSGFLMDLTNFMTGGNQRFDLGFDVQTFQYDGDVIYLIRGTTGANQMGNPLTRDDEGEGIVRINPETGEVKYRNYFVINEDGINISQYQFNIFDQPEPQIINDKMYVMGTDRVVCADLKNGNVAWQFEEDVVLPHNWWIVGDNLFIQSGMDKWNTGLDPKEGEVKVNKAWDEDPYMLFAFNMKNGNLLWKKEYDNDLSLGMKPNFDEKTGTLYCSDTENLYAIKLDENSSGEKAWVFNYDDNEVGELEKEESFAVTQSVTTSFDMFGALFGKKGIAGGIKQSYAAEAELVLQAVYRDDHFIVFGPDGIASVDLQGNRQWFTEWDWDFNDVQLMPSFLDKSEIIYMMNGDIFSIDEKTGEVKWTADDSDGVEVRITPDEKNLLIIEKKYVRVYSL